PYPTSITLKDGTHLCGSLRRLDKAKVTFLSASLGKLELPMSNVAVITLGDGELGKSVKSPNDGSVVACLQSGAVMKGSIFAAVGDRIVFKTAKGIEKLNNSDIDSLVFSSYSKSEKITLRNGDRINVAGSWKGNRYEYQFAGSKRHVSLDAMRIIQFN
ncbi:hypothetical protein BVX97_00615, partial [bacterium E08(2017)]